MKNTANNCKIDRVTNSISVPDLYDFREWDWIKQYPGSFGTSTLTYISNHVLEAGIHEFDFPGIKSEEIKISLDTNTLSISITGKSETKNSNKIYTYIKFLAKDIDLDKINATYDCGLIRLELVKVANNVKNIEIRTIPVK